MKLFNEDQIKRLEALQGVVFAFHTTTESGFKRGTSSIIDNAVADIFQEVLEKGDEPIQRQFGCKICNYNFYKRVGTHYFNSKKEIEKQEEEVIKMVTDLAKDKKTTTNKPKGRPKKKKE